LKIGVVGLGVGYALSCALAEAGYMTVGLDINADVVANPRRDPSIEPLLSNKMSRRRIERNLKLTSSYGEIADCNYVIICVSTGDEKKLVLGHVEDAVQQCVSVLQPSRARPMPVVMVYSTLPFGSSKRIREIFRASGIKMNEDVGYVHFPLMIAQGTTAYDFVNPPFVIFGSDSPSVAKRAMDFYKRFVRRSLVYKGRLPPMFTGSPEEAELAKLAANACLTTKIAIANEIGGLGERLGVDAQKVMQVVGSDWRIGRKFTIPGYAVGGSCFPRDLKSLIETFGEAGAVPRILRAVDESNRERLLDPLDKIEGKNVLVLGKSYKSAVPETKGSPGLSLTEVLRERGYNVEAYDPKFDSVPPRLCPDTVIVTLAEPEFSNLAAITGKGARVVLDYADVVDRSSLPSETRFWQAGRGWISRSRNDMDRVRQTKN
jgi:UDPglucose 6-dehydrogenase